MAGFYSFMVVAMRISVWEWRCVHPREKRELKRFSCHMGGCWLQLSLLYIMTELTVFSGWEAASPPTLPPLMSTGRDFTLKRDSSGNEENVEFGWKIPNAFLSQVIFVFLSGGQGDLPYSPIQAERKSMLRTCKAEGSNGGRRKAMGSVKCGSLSTQVTSRAIGCAVLTDEGWEAISSPCLVSQLSLASIWLQHCMFF